MHGNEPDAANRVVVVEAVHTEEDIIAPAPGVMCTGHRRKAPKVSKLNLPPCCRTSGVHPRCVGHDAALFNPAGHSR